MKADERKKFDEIKRRVNDMHAVHGQDIKEGKFLRVTAEVFSEMAWLVRKVEELERTQKEPAA